jgi:hypothetical protein
MERGSSPYGRSGTRSEFGRYVYVAFSRDERQVGFSFPKDERANLIAEETDRFLMPSTGDLRYQ